MVAQRTSKRTSLDMCRDLQHKRLFTRTDQLWLSSVGSASAVTLCGNYWRSRASWQHGIYFFPSVLHLKNILSLLDKSTFCCLEQPRLWSMRWWRDFIWPPAKTGTWDSLWTNSNMKRHSSMHGPCLWSQSYCLHLQQTLTGNRHGIDIML